MMWHAGLRGGIALVLTLRLGDWVDHEALGGSNQREVLRNATVLLICVFLLVFGGSTDCCLKALGIPMGSPPPMYLQGTRATACLLWFNAKALKPLLKGSDEKALTMHGSILKHLVQQSGASGPDSPVPERSESAQRWDLFGRTDPIGGRGWAEGGAPPPCPAGSQGGSGAGEEGARETA